ncbi:hypothetical protein [Legionella sp. 227]|uniref:hypothetical protein n=1 Tax=Legionella sp. 227 TaxID=3367288 RepID=UPI00370DA450
MTRFFKMNSEKNQLEECNSSESPEFIEIYWNWVALAIPIVLGLEDAVKKFNDRFELVDGSYSVINPSTWFALFEYNSKYCSTQEAEVLSKATLAIRPS